LTDPLASQLEAIRALRTAGRHEEVLPLAKALVAAYPQDARAQYAAACAHDRLGFERDAIRYYDEVFRLGVPADVRRGFYVGYGSTLRNVGRLDDAIAILGQAIADDPGYPAYGAFLALALGAAGHPRAALAAMLGCALDAARPDAFDGYERALTEYHRELLETPLSSP